MLVTSPSNKNLALSPLYAILQCLNASKILVMNQNKTSLDLLKYFYKLLLRVSPFIIINFLFLFELNSLNGSRVYFLLFKIHRIFVTHDLK